MEGSILRAYISENIERAKRKYSVGGIEISRFCVSLRGGRSRPLDCGQVHLLGRL